MTKEQEALKNIKIRCHSKSMKYDPIDFDLDTVEEALINYANITKQIEEADYKSAIGLLVKVKDNLDSYTYNIILEALLKAQEPKKYLKWEDLEFDKNKEIDVLMNGNKYVLELRPKDTRMEYLDEVILYNIEKYGVIALNEIEAETFNDLHLERVE